MDRAQQGMVLLALAGLTAALAPYISAKPDTPTGAGNLPTADDGGAPDPASGTVAGTLADANKPDTEKDAAGNMFVTLNNVGSPTFQDDTSEYIQKFLNLVQYTGGRLEVMSPDGKIMIDVPTAAYRLLTMDQGPGIVMGQFRFVFLGELRSGEFPDPGQYQYAIQSHVWNNLTPAGRALVIQLQSVYFRPYSSDTFNMALDKYLLLEYSDAELAAARVLKVPARNNESVSSVLAQVSLPDEDTFFDSITITRIGSISAITPAAPN